MARRRSAAQWIAEAEHVLATGDVTRAEALLRGAPIQQEEESSMGQVRNSRIVRAGHGPHNKPTTHHEHADGKAHHHAKGHEPHEHQTSAQRFAARYPDGAPFGDKPKTSTATTATPDASTASTGGAWHHEHPYLIVVLAVIVALALIAVFTPITPAEQHNAAYKLQPAATATVQPTARHIIYPRTFPTSTRTRTATATPEATPCARLLPYCDTTPVDRFGQTCGLRLTCETATPDTSTPTERSY